MLKKSNYLIVLENKKGHYLVYHSLYGNACLIDKHGLNLLEYFKNPVNKDEFLKLVKTESKSDANLYIDELNNRRFLVNDDVDERQYIKRDMEYRDSHCSEGYLSRVLQLITSNTCNFRCKYCFEKSMYKSEARTMHQSSEGNQCMTVSVAKSAIDQMIDILKVNNNKVLTIEFFGGEPLTNWAMMKEVFDHYENGDSELRIAYSVTTNGSLINEEMATYFNKYGVTVTISFDSPQSTARVRLDGKSAMELLLPKLELLRRTNNWVTFNSVLSKETISTYDGISLIDFAKEYNVKMIGLILDLDLQFYRDEENRNDVLNKIWTTYKYASKNNIEIVGYWHQIHMQIIGKQGTIFQTGYKTCPATGCKISVEPAGHVYICKCCSEYMGENDISSVLKTEQYKDYAMRAYLNSPECIGCEIEGFCSGVCMGSLEKKYEKLYGIEESSCEIFKEITKKLLLNVSEEDLDLIYLEADLIGCELHA